MTAEVSKTVTYAVVATAGGAEVTKTVTYAVMAGSPASSAGSTSNPALRVWTFSLDNHEFYVIRLGNSQTLVYDLSTGTWAHWSTPSEEKWRAHIGQNWVGSGATTTNRNFGSDVVAGDDRTGTLWMLDPTAGVDDNDTTGSTQFTRKVTGGVSLRGRTSVRCDAVQLTISLGSPIGGDTTIALRTSDDAGKVWQSQGSVTINALDYEEVVEFRSLGSMGEPGRIFEITDKGAAVRISGADLR